MGFLSSRGTRNSIGRHNLAVLEAITLPIEKIIALVDGPSRSIEFVGSSVSGGRNLYQVRITRTAVDANELIALGRSSFTTDVFIDQQSFEITAIGDTIHPNNHTRDAFQHLVVYQDYRPVAGIQIPFSIKEAISGQLTWGLQLESFDPNVRLADIDFSLN